MKVLILSDNERVYRNIEGVVSKHSIAGARFDFRCQPGSRLSHVLDPIDADAMVGYDVVISTHSNHILPPRVVQSRLCINLHPGYNPYNRGWHPHVFSMLDGSPVGVTLHVMDERIDTGPIIDREEVPVEATDTGGDVLEKIYELEKVMFDRNIEGILEGTFSTYAPEFTGTLNTRKDFEAICELDLSRVGTLGEHIHVLRSLTNTNYRNAFFVDDGQKIFVNVDLKRE
jgi:methionyl-tRNA formyltransferase